MTRVFIFFIITLLFTSCISVKEALNPESIQINNGVFLKILKYYEPVNKSPYLIDADQKFVDIMIEIENSNTTPIKLEFTNFNIANYTENKKYELLSVNRTLELVGTENKSVQFNALEKKKLTICYIIPKSVEINSLFIGDKKIKLQFDKVTNQL
jgi:hypothetical protein